MVTKPGMANALQHLLGLFPDSITVQSAFVAPAQLRQLDAAIEEALDSDSRVDCLPLVPLVLSNAHMMDLVSMSHVSLQV